MQKEGQPTDEHLAYEMLAKLRQAAVNSGADPWTLAHIMTIAGKHREELIEMKREIERREQGNWIQRNITDKLPFGGNAKLRAAEFTQQHFSPTIYNLFQAESTNIHPEEWAKVDQVLTGVFFPPQPQIATS